MFRKTLIFLGVLMLTAVMITACMPAGDEQAGETTVPAEEAAQPPDIPEDLERGDDGVPMLDVYVMERQAVERMDLETYLMGVVAGEMKNDWPIEALKAQAILARTYTLNFLDTKESKHGGADISTDVEEAQAYNADSINERIEQAVNETRGVVMSYDGELPMAWFHAHAGGVTELPTVALEYKENPPYLSVVSSPDSEQAPDDVKNWTARFSAATVGKACADSGAKTGDAETVEVGKKGESGRAETLVVNGQEVSAPSFRVHIGATELKSTLIESIEVNDGEVIFTGRGFGHGVGMSQWGAYGLAENGATAQSIISAYFKDVDFVGLWE
ncbi:MAG: SpoIID/LytB domain-containing protein [Christensenellales bacterium]|jgi:stage II sporulation protein D